jgi:transposase
MAWHKSNPMSQRLAAIPGIGPIIATAIAATVAEPGALHVPRVRCLARSRAATELHWRQNAPGRDQQTRRLYLRRLLVNGAPPRCCAPRPPRPILG